MMTSTTRQGRPYRQHLMIIAIAASMLLAPLTATAQQDDERIWLETKSEHAIDADSPLRFSSLANLAQKLSPSVVNVIVTYGGDSLEGILGSDWEEKATIAQGTGFIIHPSGYILTNNHVVEGASAIKVRMLDGTEYKAKIVGLDPQTDIALMKVSPKGELPAMPLGDSDEVRVGEHVLAIGNPLGLTHTVTTGIVSALGRRDLNVGGKELYADFIQTDASINPGNSGGPLIGLDGSVVGMNTAINRQGQGIGFAIPINMVKTLIPQLKDTGYVVRSWLGIRVQALDKKLAESFGLSEARGALVTEVVDDSPAAQGGVEAGDVVLEFGNSRVKHSDQLPWLASTAGPGRTVQLAVIRDNRRQTVEVTMARLPNQDVPDIPSMDTSKPSTGGDFGVQVKELTKSLARKLGAESKEGVVVTGIGDSSPAKQAGLRQRDVITQIGNSSITNKTDFDEAIDAAGTGDLVRLKIIRGGRVVYMAVER
ncbi:MAG: Do family serine endopeptidase [Myxococcota bacterium]